AGRRAAYRPVGHRRSGRSACRRAAGTPARALFPARLCPRRHRAGDRRRTRRRPPLNPLKEFAMRRLLLRIRDDAGIATAEYAIVTLAAVAFGGLLLKVVTSTQIQAALAHLIERALK